MINNMKFQIQVDLLIGFLLEEEYYKKMTGDEAESRNLIYSLNDYGNENDNGDLGNAVWYMRTNNMNQINVAVRRDENDNGAGKYKVILIRNYESNNIEWLESSSLITYLATDARTYLFKETHLNRFGEFWPWITGKLDEVEKIGMVVLKGNAKALQEDPRDLEEYFKISHRMSIDKNEKSLFISSDNKYYEGYKFDMNGWLGKYGRPVEFSLAIHLATMAPDLAYKVATDKEIEAEVKLDLFNAMYSRRVVTTSGGDAVDFIVEEIVQAIENYKYTPWRPATQGEIDAGQATDIASGFQQFLGIHNYVVRGEELSGWLAIYYALDDSRVYTGTAPQEWMDQYGEFISKLMDNPSSLVGNEVIKLIGMSSNLDFLIATIAYNEENANLNWYIPYIYSVEKHWYRDLLFGDPQITDGYIVKTDVTGAAPIATDKETLSKIIDAYSAPGARANLKSAIPDLLKIQEKYKVNAIFAMAVAIKEQGGGTSDSTCNNKSNNWYSIKGNNPNTTPR